MSETPCNKTTIEIHTEYNDDASIDFEKILYLLKNIAADHKDLSVFAGVFSTEPEKWFLTMHHEKVTC
jgi:hypothetical protein